ncbi:MAG: glycosyltransferase family 4 protein, partial [Acidimicrobiia bacterium]
LAAIGPRVRRVVAAPKGGALYETVRQRGLADQILLLPRGRRFRRLLRVAGALRLIWWVVPRRQKLLAIHANAMTGFYLAAPAAILSRVPVVAWVHDSISTPWGRRLGPMLRRLSPKVRWVAVSRTAAEVPIANRASGPDDVQIVPNPIDKSEVVGSSHRRDQDGRIRVGFLGAPTRAKGFDLLPPVIEGLSDLPIEWMLFTNRGSTDLEAPIWKKLESLTDARINELGRVSDVRRAYERCDLIFNPSRFESFSRVTAEAMMNGLPVVGSDLPALRDLLGNNEAGLLFPPGEPKEAAEALRSLIADPALRATLSSAGLRRGARFEPADIADQMLAIYEVPTLSADEEKKIW